MIRFQFVSKILPIVALSHVLFDGVGNCTEVGISTTNYPNVRRDENVCDTYPGDTKVKDPYRWLEKVDCDETKKFVELENAVSRSYLDKGPYRTELEARYKELYSYKICDAFFQVGKKYFSYQNDGSPSQKQDVIYEQDSPTGEAKVFLDPNTLSKDGSVTLNYAASTFSHNDMIYAYMLNTDGSSWSTIKFKHVEKGDIYPETLTKVRCSYVTFNGDDKGIFYSGYLDHKGKLDASDYGPLKNHKLYYHILGTDQSKDIVVAEFPDKPDSAVSGWVSGQGKYLVVFLTANSENCNCFVYVVDLVKINYKIKGQLDLIPVVTKDEGMYSIVTVHDGTFIFHTNQGADNYKLISFNIANISKTWKNLVPEDKENKLEFATSVNFDKHMILCYTVDAKSILQLHDKKTGEMIKRFDMEIGWIDSSDFFGDTAYSDFYFVLRTFTSPGIIYHCDLSKEPFELNVFRETELPHFNREKFITEQMFFKSKDGTKIPMFIVHNKDLQKNGNNPIFMVNNGAYGGSYTPFFMINRQMFLDNLNGVYVIVNCRGGVEYGEKWHQAGILHNKQNAIDDVIAALEYLIAEKYTTAKLISGYGFHHSATILAACINQRPDLFAVAVLEAGMFDMLRFDKFSDGVGDSWIPEVGSPNNDTDFPSIFKYSPLHSIKIPECADKQYPAILMIIPINDYMPRPHSYKYIATLQFEAKKHSNQKNPFIITIDTTTPDQSKNMDDQTLLNLVTKTFADLYSFVAENTGIKFQPSC